MKTSNKSLLVIIWCITNMAGNTVEQPPTGAQAKDWYTDWVRSQENPYIKMRALELGKKISKERGKVVDMDPRGWFKRFLLERVRGKLVVEAYAARKDAKKVEEEANDSELEILLDNAGGAGGMSTTSAITAIGGAILGLFIFGCCLVIFCKK